MTFTRLRVGTKPFKSKPPRKGPPCTEPYIQGSNILRDPGFELHDANVPNGPNGWDFPGDGFGPGGANPGSLYWHTTYISDLLYYDLNGWAVWSNNNGGDGLPVLSTVNPRNGTYHFRTSFPPNTFASTYPIPIGGRYCNPVSGLIQPYSARIEPGDFVRFGAWIMANTTIGTPIVTISMAFYDASAAKVGATIVGPSPALTTAYAFYEADAFAPATAYTVIIEPDLGISGTQTAAIDFDVDDLELEIASGEVILGGGTELTIASGVVTL